MKLYFKQPITFEMKGKLIDVLFEHCTGNKAKETYGASIDLGYINTTDEVLNYPITISSLKALDIWQEPEPDYNEWIGEDCVFARIKIEGKTERIRYGVLVCYEKNKEGNIEFTNGDGFYKYCMLKSDYVKLLKEQSK